MKKIPQLTLPKKRKEKELPWPERALIKSSKWNAHHTGLANFSGNPKAEAEVKSEVVQKKKKTEKKGPK